MTRIETEGTDFKYFNQRLKGGIPVQPTERKPRADTGKFCTVKVERGFPEEEA